MKTRFDKAVMKFDDEYLYQIKETRYFLTKTGKVYSNFNKRVFPDNNFRLLKQHNRNGYPSVRINIDVKKKHHTVHRLMADMFLEEKEGFDQVNHIDGNKENNNIDNLERSNSSHNMFHAYKNGLMVPQYNRRGMNGKLSGTNKEVVEFDLNGNKIREYESLVETKEEGYNPVSVSRNCRGFTKSYKNRIFKFKNKELVL